MMKNDDELYLDVIVDEGIRNVIRGDRGRYLFCSRIGIDTKRQTYTILSRGFTGTYIGSVKNLIEESEFNYRDFLAKRGFEDNMPGKDFKMTSGDWWNMDQETVDLDKLSNLF